MFVDLIRWVKSFFGPSQNPVDGSQARLRFGNRLARYPASSGVEFARVLRFESDRVVILRSGAGYPFRIRYQ